MLRSRVWATAPRALWVVVVLIFAAPASASPWAEVGDQGLRSDLEILANHGPDIKQLYSRSRGETTGELPPGLGPRPWPRGRRCRGIGGAGDRQPSSLPVPQNV